MRHRGRDQNSSCYVRVARPWAGKWGGAWFLPRIGDEVLVGFLLTVAQAEVHPQANVILRAVGAAGELMLDKVSGRVVPGDVLLLCSDGLFKALPEAEMAEMLRQGAGAADVVKAAVLRNARDNVSVALLRAAG